MAAALWAAESVHMASPYTRRHSRATGLGQDVDMALREIAQHGADREGHTASVVGHSIFVFGGTWTDEDENTLYLTSGGQGIMAKTFEE